MAYLSKQKVKEIIDNAPPGTSPAGIVAELKKKGHTLEGLNDKTSEARKVAQEVEKGFFADLGGDIKETVQGIKQGFRRGQERTTRAQAAEARGEQTGFETGFQALGASASAFSNLVGETVVGAGKALLSENMERRIGGAVKGAVNKVVESELGQDLAQKYENFRETNPRSARNLEAALGIGEIALDLAGGFAGKQAAKGAVRAASTDVAQEAAKASRRVAAKGATTAKNAARKAKDATGEAVAFGTSKASGFDPDTIKFIYNNPDAFKQAQKAGVTRETLADKFINRLQKRQKALDDMGEAYDDIRAIDDLKVDVDTKDLFQNTLEGLGFKVRRVEPTARKGELPTIQADGVPPIGAADNTIEIIPTTRSVTRKQADINHIENIYNTWKDVDQLTPEEYLNLRADLADLAKFDRISGKTRGSETVAKKLRAKLNKNYRDQIPGLKQLDDTFSKEKKELKRIRKDFFNRDGTLKDSAINKIANAGGKGKRELMKRLEKVQPGIEAQVKMVKALEDVDVAGGLKVGDYFRSGVLAGSTFVATQNPVIGLFTLFATTPSLMTKYISWAGKLRGVKARTLNNIQDKIKKGTKLNPTENIVVQNLLQELRNPDTVNRFLESAGATAGVGAVEAPQQVLQEPEQPRLRNTQAPSNLQLRTGGAATPDELTENGLRNLPGTI